MNFADTKEYLTSRQFIPSRKLGQNFLINDNIPKTIVSNVDLSNVDLIIEIGPGLGALTDHLINQKIDLTLIEIDKRLNKFLNNRFKDSSLKIINQDVLRVSLEDVTKGYKNPIIISNLPYSISSQVLIKFLKTNNIKKMYCMLQKEMVDRISAKVNTKKYNGLTAMVSYYAKIDRLMNISPNNFYPIPEVDSLFIKIEKNEKKYDEHFDKFLRTCFLNRRKTIANNLKNQYDMSKIKSALEINKIQPSIRAETLTSEQLHKLYLTFEND